MTDSHYLFADAAVRLERLGYWLTPLGVECLRECAEFWASTGHVLERDIQNLVACMIDNILYPGV